MSSWSLEDHVCHQTELLVDAHGEGGGRVCGGLSCLLQEQNFSSPTHWSSPSSACSSSPLVRHLPGFCHWLASFVTVVDQFSKMVRFIRLPKLPSAKETAEAMHFHVFCPYGLSRDVMSDQGPRFIFQFWKPFCFLIGNTVSLSGYHHQPNGQSERLNQELDSCLCCCVSQNLATWSKHPIWISYAHNTLPGSASSLSPFQCSYGY